MKAAPWINLDETAYLDGEDDEMTVTLGDPHMFKGLGYKRLKPEIEAWLAENDIAYKLGQVFDPGGWDPVTLTGDFQRPGIAFTSVADAAWFRMRW